MYRFAVVFLDVLRSAGTSVVARDGHEHDRLFEVALEVIGQPAGLVASHGVEANGAGVREPDRDCEHACRVRTVQGLGEGSDVEACLLDLLVEGGLREEVIEVDVVGGGFQTGFVDGCRPSAVMRALTAATRKGGESSGIRLAPLPEAEA